MCRCRLFMAPPRMSRGEKNCASAAPERCAIVEEPKHGSRFTEEAPSPVRWGSAIGPKASGTRRSPGQPARVGRSFDKPGPTGSAGCRPYLFRPRPAGAEERGSALPFAFRHGRATHGSRGSSDRRPAPSGERGLPARVSVRAAAPRRSGRLVPASRADL